MERLMLIFITIISFLIVMPSYALSPYEIIEYENKTKVLSGGDMSGGGYIVVCKDPVNQKESYELLDYFEARYIIKDFELDNLSSYPGQDVFEKAKSIIENRLGNWSQYVTADLVNIINNFKKRDINFISRAIIVDISDDETVVDPESNCIKKQVAVQIKKPSINQYRVLVDKSAWSKLNLNTQIGLIIHEALYTIGLDQGHLNSNKIRILNSLLVNRNKIKTFELKNLFKHVQIEGCIDLSVKMLGSENIPSQHYKFPVNISSYNIGEENNSGIICKNFQMNNFREGVLSLAKGTVIKHYFNNWEGVIFEDTDGKSYNNRFYLPFQNYGFTFWGELIFSNYYNSITGSTDSTLKMGYHSIVNIKECKEQRFEIDILGEYKLVSCEEVDGELLIGNNKFPINSYRVGNYQKEIYIDLNSDYFQLEVNSILLKLSSKVEIKDDFIYAEYKGPSIKLSFNGEDFELFRGQQLVFSFDGSLIRIK